MSLKFPDVSVALAVILFKTLASVTDLLQEVVPVAVCHTPDPTLTSTLLNPTLSDAVPLTVMVAVVNFCLGVGKVIVMVGGVTSEVTVI